MTLPASSRNSLVVGRAVSFRQLPDTMSGQEFLHCHRCPMHKKGGGGGGGQKTVAVAATLSCGHV